MTCEAFIERVRVLFQAVADGADAYEVRDEIDAIEREVAVIDGVLDSVCQECGSKWEPRHRHLDPVVWVKP